MQINKNTRRMLWMGKFAFPKANTKTTKIQCVPRGMQSYRIPVLKPITLAVDAFDLEQVYNPIKMDTVELGKFGYSGKRWQSTIKCAYYERTDTLLVMNGSFTYEKRPTFYEATQAFFKRMRYLDDF